MQKRPHSAKHAQHDPQPPCISQLRLESRHFAGSLCGINQFVPAKAITLTRIMIAKQTVLCS